MEAHFVEKLLSRSTEDIHLYVLTDFHIGHINHDEKKFNEAIRIIREDPLAMVLILGDIADKRDYKHKFFDPDQQAPIARKNFIWECYKLFKKKIKPIKDKIIGMHCGNHDMSGTDTHYIEEICADLGIKYLGYRAITVLRIRLKGKGDCNRAFTIFSSHGSGGGRNNGSKVNRIEQEALSTEADIYLQGHNHFLNHTYGVIHSAVLYGSRVSIVEKPKLFVNCGSFLKSYQEGNYTYSEKASYRPQPTGYIKITISPRSRALKCEEIT